MRTGKYLTFVVAWCVVMAGMAAAGTVIQQEQREPGSGAAQQRVTLYVDAGKLRIEGDNPEGGKYLMIFNQGQQVIWMVDAAKGTYFEMTTAQLEGLGNQMQQIMDQMRAQMENMPPQQRQMMEQMMQGQMQTAAAPQVTVEEKGQGEKVGSYVCTRYAVLTDGQLTEEIWAAPVEDLRIDPAAFQTFEALGEFYEPLRRRMPKNSWAMPDMKQIDGFPVRSVSYENQQPVREWVVVKAETQSLAADLFALPPGLKKMTMPEMPAMPEMQ